MARYKIIAESGAYMSRDPTIVRLELGGGDSAGARAYNVRAPISELLVQGTEIEFEGIPGPHLEPLDADAKERMAAYWERNPMASLDPTRSLPLGVDPMAPRTLEKSVMAQLERMAAESILAASKPASDPKLDAMMAAITQLTAVVAHLVSPPSSPRKGA